MVPIPSSSSSFISSTKSREAHSTACASEKVAQTGCTNPASNCAKSASLWFSQILLVAGHGTGFSWQKHSVFKYLCHLFLQLKTLYIFRAVNKINVSKINLL
jgi:hypothetical protein